MEKNEGPENALKVAEPMPASPPAITNGASDPEEDDLDDLDDMLDEFSAIKTSESQDKCRQSKVRPETVNDEIETTDEAGTEFSKQLQEQMAALMGPGIESPEIKREIEGLMRDLGAAVDPGATQEGSDMPEGGEILQAQLPSSEEPFQETIRRTMERMQASGEQAAAAANSEDADNMMANLLKEVRDSDFNGAGDEEGMNKMLLGMMEELTNKDILYEPMKELHDKFPAWMAQNRDHTEADDLKRYDKQQKLVAEIVGKFEQKGYSDNETGDRAYIVERMQQMQVAGNPPADLVGDMNAAREILGDIGSGCPIQ